MSESVLLALREIAQDNAELPQRTEEQAASLEETASSMAELTSTVRQNADNAQQARGLARRREGGELVGDVVETMHELALVLGFSPKFGAMIQTIPGPVLGGVSIVVFGLIAVTGTRIWVVNKVEDNFPADSPFFLSRRQRELADLVVAGYSNKEIAKTIGISCSTVKNHLTKMMSCLNVGSRRKLAAKLRSKTFRMFDGDPPQFGEAGSRHMAKQ